MPDCSATESYRFETPHYYSLSLLSGFPLSGICHGVAGSGYVQLLLYRLTGEDRFLKRAQACVTFMQMERGARAPDCPLSLFEGRAGTAVFQVDLANFNEACFPFMEVFGA